MPYQSIFADTGTSTPNNTGGNSYASPLGLPTVSGGSSSTSTKSKKKKQDTQSQQPAPQVKTQGASLFSKAKAVAKPLKDAAVDTVKTTGNIASIPYDIAKTVPASLTHNKQAEANASKKANKNIDKAADFLRFAPKAAVQVAESVPVPILNPHPSKNNIQVTKKAPGIVKSVLGKDPIPSIQSVYQTTKKQAGTPTAIGATAATVIGDALAFKGGAKSIKSVGDKVDVVKGDDVKVNKLLANTKTNQLIKAGKNTPPKTITAQVNQAHVDQGLIHPELKQTPIKTLAISAERNQKIDGQKVSQYAKQIKDGEPIEPIVTHTVNGHTFVVDGEHRLAAAKKLGIDTVPTVEKVTGAIPGPKAVEARPLDSLQTAIETAHNTGDVATAKKLEAQLPDRGMNPDAPPLTPEARAELTAKMRAEPVAAAKVDTPTTTAVTEHSSRVYQRLKAEHPEELKDDVGYTAVNLKEQAERATSLMAEDKQKLYRVATGQESSPDITSTSANIALAEKALDEGNTKLYGDLIRNRSLAQTRRGQELVSEKASISDNSTSRYVKELLSSRMEQLGKRHTMGINLRKTTPHEAATAAVDREVKKIDLKIRNKKLDTKTALGLLDRMECL